MSSEKPSLPAEYVVPKVWAPPESAGAFATNREYSGAWGEDKPLPKGEHPLQLYSLGTPNGVKVTILLEELVDLFPDFEYDAWLISIRGDQFTSGFVGANPNSKIPALLDYSDPEKPVRVFESGSILVYLADRFDKDGLFFPKEYPARAEVMNWVMWIQGAAPFIGGGFGHFYNYAPVRIEYAIDRYSMEAKRLLDVLDKQLAAGGPYICGAQYTIADMAVWPWMGWLVDGVLYSGGEFLQTSKYTHAVAWSKLMAERPAVIRGKMVNRPFGEKSTQLKDRHARGDFETQTEDKINP